jgi:hypothetical protein
MRYPVSVATAAALAALVAVFALAGAAGAGSAPARVNLSTDAAVKAYLTSIGVNPATTVIQRGHKNYAGPDCPGATWTCTDARSVVQLGTQNTAECVGGIGTNTPAGFQQCLIVQGPAAKNVAKCIQRSHNVPFVRQRCSVTQTGNFNEATIVQVAEQTGGTTHGALQEVGLSQTAAASTNRLQIDQEIKQSTETSVGATQDQDAYQVVGNPFIATTSPTGPATQTAALDGDNASQIVQRQIQRAKGGAIQRQNDGVYAPPAPFGGAPADCHPASVISPANPNACVNLEQTAADGTNHQGQLTQTLDQEETTTVVGAVQRQNPAKFTGGADARVHQLITGTTGSSQNQANQSETLKMLAPPGADQEQHGGAGCCGVGSQEGGVDNSEQISQQKSLVAQGGTIQTATLVGTSRSPDGDCAVNHSAQTNSDQSSTSQSAEPCFGLIVVTTCENATVGEDEEEVVGACEDAEVEICGPGETPVVGESGVTCQGEIIIDSPEGLRAFDYRR